MRSVAKKPRTKPPEERRDELIVSAQKLFLEQGVGPTTIEQITSGAQVAKGTFYLYFASKEEVLAALTERFAQQILGSVQRAVDRVPSDDWAGKLATWTRVCVSSYLESIQLHDLLFINSQHNHARDGLTDNIVIDHLQALLQAGIDAEAWSLDDARFAAVYLFNGLHGVVDDAYLKEKRLNRTRLCNRLNQLVFRLVGLPAQ